MLTSTFQAASVAAVRHEACHRLFALDVVSSEEWGAVIVGIADLDG